MFDLTKLTISTGTCKTIKLYVNFVCIRLAHFAKLYQYVTELQSAKLVVFFNEYFFHKITRIRKDLDQEALRLPPDLSDTNEAASSSATLPRLSILDVEKLVSS
jgi:hypothetical protein